MRRVAEDTAEQRTSECDVMVARQPIYNNRMGVYGYELLFRSSGSTPGELRPTEATAQVLATTILNFGLDGLVLHRKAIINVTRAFLDIMSDIQLPTEQVVLDIPDNIVVDDKLVEKLKELGGKGYGISVGGLANLNDLQRLFPYASIFRIDVHQVDIKQLDALVKYLRRYEHLSLQAIKIETMEEYRFYCDRGFDLFQGYFLSKPREYVSRDLPPNKLAILQLLAVIHKADTSARELEEHITHDVASSYKLLKLVNAPFFGVAREVDSIKHAIVLLGRDEIRKWVSLLALGGLSDQPAALMEVAVLRAKICELLASKAKLPRDSYFTVGMFSALDMLMQQPIDGILAKLPLSDAVKHAILEHEGPMGRALSCTLALENAEWSAIAFENLDQDDMLDAYREAIQWTDGVIKTL
jgi:EAL and modified HD-GYP domain-containing signal transduction protein